MDYYSVSGEVAWQRRVNSTSLMTMLWPQSITLLPSVNAFCCLGL